MLPYEAHQIISEECYLEPRIWNFIVSWKSLREEVEGDLLNTLNYDFTRLKRALPKMR